MKKMKESKLKKDFAGQFRDIGRVLLREKIEERKKELKLWWSLIKSLLKNIKMTKEVQQFTYSPL